MTTLSRGEPALAARAGAAQALLSVVVPTFRRGNRLALFLDRLSGVEQAGLLDVLIVDQTPGAVHDDLNGLSRFFASLSTPFSNRRMSWFAELVFIFVRTLKGAFVK